MIRQTQQRWGAAALAALLLFAALVVVHQLSQAPSALESTAQAYSGLGQALSAAGLLPFPRDLAGLQTAPALHGAHTPPFQASTDNQQQPVYQFGAVLTVMTANGHPSRYLLNVTHANELAGTPLGSAMSKLARLPLARQQTVHFDNNAGLPVHDQQFFFEYSSAGSTWRLIPQFDGDRCVRVDVEPE